MGIIRHLEGLVKAFNWNTPSWDLFILAAWIAVSIFYALAAGRGRVLAVLISLYIARLITSEVLVLSEFAETYLPKDAGAYAPLCVFVALFLILFFLLSKYAFRTSVDSRKLGAIVFTTGFALLQMGLLVQSILTLLPSNISGELSPLVTFVFVAAGAQMFWLLAPIVFLVVLGRFVSDKAD